MMGFIRPTRPIASCTVATPNDASRSAAARSARTMLRLTMPIWYMSLASLLQCGVESRVDAACVAFVNLRALFSTEPGRFDITFGVVVVVAGLWVHAAHRADHLAGE